MARVITFSRVFPKGHPKAGKETNFIQKIWTAIKVPLPCSVHADQLNEEMMKLFLGSWRPKYHTIRAGHRFKVGDKFSPRVWSGKPYASKQIIIADDIEVKKTWDVEMDENQIISIDGKYIHEFDDLMKFDSWERLAINDGLSLDDFLCWFDKLPFKGQIICWNENINY